MKSPSTSSSWTAFSDQYFEGGFEHPFLELCGDKDSCSSKEEGDVGGESAEDGGEETAPSDQPLSGTVEVGDNDERENSVESSPNSLG